MANSGASTPRNFMSQAASAEELLKSQTVGLVQLNDFRKRRRDAEDLRSDGISTPRSDASEVESDINFKKKKRKLGGRKLLSYHDDDEESQETLRRPAKVTQAAQQDTHSEDAGVAAQPTTKHKLAPNPTTAVPAPKAMTKASLAAEAAERERLRIEFMRVQEQVRDSEIAIPFVFYDGSNLPGGMVKVKKGEHIWLFLERCRKVGAAMGVNSEGSVEGGGTRPPSVGKKSWARIGVDDLMLVKRDIIIPHHYEFYYFIANKVADPNQPEKLLFDYSGTTSVSDNSEEPSLLRNPKNERIEGQDDDATYTKVVDRRWYEKNKHIYPASLWREYKSDKNLEELRQGRKDTQGNTFFFS